MANTQDLYNLQYSQPFAIQGLQEEGVNLTLSALPADRWPPYTVR